MDSVVTVDMEGPGGILVLKELQSQGLSISFGQSLELTSEDGSWEVSLANPDCESLVVS